MQQSRDEFKKKLADPASRKEMGVELSGDEVAAILADDAEVDRWQEKLTPVVEDLSEAPPPALVNPGDASEAKPKRRPDRNTMVALVVVAFAVVAVIVVMAVSAFTDTHNKDATATNTSSTHDPDTSSGNGSGDTSSEDSPDIPDGFVDAGNGIAFAWHDTTGETDPCSYHSLCVVADVYAYDNCPGGVYLEAKVMDSSGVVVDRANDMIPALSAGERARSILGWTNDAGTNAKMTQIHCY